MNCKNWIVSKIVSYGLYIKFNGGTMYRVMRLAPAQNGHCKTQVDSESATASAGRSRLDTLNLTQNESEEL